MKEKRDKDKHKKKKKQKEKKRKHRSPSTSSKSESDEWVEKETRTKLDKNEREDWMSMTGLLKTYTKEDVKPKKEVEKKHIDSYNPGTSTRELNPYWKDGGTGLPQTPESFRKSRPFIKPTNDDDDYYSSSSSRKHQNFDRGRSSNDKTHEKKGSYRDSDSYNSRSYNWKKASENKSNRYDDKEEKPIEDSYITGTKVHSVEKIITESETYKSIGESKYLSDEKMNKLAAKIVKAEIMGDSKLVEELKAKLEAARVYRKENPNAGKEDEDEGIMLTTTTSTGNTRPLVKGVVGDPRSKSGKRKAETHASGQRTKYFANDDKYDLQQMFQQEKYTDNYDEEAQLAKIASKHKNPNDDLEDIFVDEISKQTNKAKDSEKERQRAIEQHKRIERSLEGCEYCVDSKNMLKHLMVSCGNKVYLALPSKTSLIKGQCLITTIQHSVCATALDEDVWEEVMNYRKALTQFFNSQDKDVVFYETATRLHRHPHMVINCVPLPRDVGDMAAIYFKKALLECEAEWSMNKKVVDLKGKDIRKGVPKGLPYFWIDFAMDPGFAHVIEDQHLFPKNFAEEIIGGFLDLDHTLWKNPKREYGDLQRKKVLEFMQEWKPFDTIDKNNK